MEQYKQEFIEFMVESDVLKFGEFTLKSGRKSSVFYECGRLCDRGAAAEAGTVYAKAIHDNMARILTCFSGRPTRGFP